CMPTANKVNEAIGRGQLDEAVEILSYILNHDGPITTRQLNNLLQALTLSRYFTLDLADKLLDNLKPEAKEVVLRWYIQQYLQVAEAALHAETFDEAREVWIRHQKVRSLHCPDVREASPVLGVIDLREAEYWGERGQTAKGRQLLEQARKKLTERQTF